MAEIKKEMEVETEVEKDVVSEEVKKINAARTDGANFTGKCKWFHYQKGFGFIDQVSDGGSEVFVHNSSITAYEGQTPCLAAGMEVKFVFVIDKDGRPRAKDITRMDGRPIRVHLSQKNTGFADKLKSDPEIRIGWCKWYNAAKGFGFITPENPADPEVFMHKGNVSFKDNITPKTIAAGQDVEYKIEKEEEGDKVKAILVTGPGGQKIGPPVGEPIAITALRGAGGGFAPGGSALLGNGGPGAMLGKRSASTALLGYTGGPQARAAPGQRTPMLMATGGGVRMIVPAAGSGLLSTSSAGMGGGMVHQGGMGGMPGMGMGGMPGMGMGGMPGMGMGGMPGMGMGGMPGMGMGGMPGMGMGGNRGGRRGR